MTDLLIVYCSCANEEEALRIGEVLVTEFLAACVNVLPPIRSLYRWQGEFETATEVVLLAKTTTARFSALAERIQELHSYDVPEIIATQVTAGSKGYLDWVRENATAS
jgi:periplasmic divalent cation tolerance protein